MVTLPQAESHHASRVVRHRPGDEIRVFDGAGTGYLVRLTMVDADRVSGEVVEERPNENEPAYDLTLAVGLLKQHARLETLVEKATELGVSTIIPLTTSRTEKAGVRRERLDKVIMAAAKQAGRSRLPRVADPATFSEYLQAAQGSLRMICHEAAHDSPLISDVLPQAQGASIHIMIGPEGGFTDDEVAAAQSTGFRVVHLGDRRLRAETAAIVAATACALSPINQTESAR